MTVSGRIFETAAGFAAIAWTEAGISRFQLPLATRAAAGRALARRLPDAAMDAAPPPAVAATIAAATAYFAGTRTDLADAPLDIAPETDFHARVYAAVRAIPWGGTTTYGTLARDLGAGPEAARDVGQAMARNPVPLLIPCHRVLAANGQPGGFSAPGGTTTKLAMLALEGVAAPQLAFGF